jgi:4-hydroxybenzoate polyprenyltransferase
MTSAANATALREPQGARAGDVPLFVDLDGTLVVVDTLFESAMSALRRHPGSLVQWPLWLAQGKAVLKRELASRGPIDVGRLPYDETVCRLLREEHARGRRIYLATAADARIAHAVAEHLGCFEGVVASDGTVNLKGRRKLESIRQVAQTFDYAGNAREDLAIWPAAQHAVVVGAPASVVRQARARGNVSQVVERRATGWRDLWQAMRPHQWVKNVLIFVPLLTSFRFTDAAALASALLAFAAFSMCASAIYILNDLLDLDADRAHPRKRNRAFAAGRVSIPAGLALSATLLLAGLGTAGSHSWPLLGVVASYVVVSTAYSLHLKQYVLLDAITLSALYTWRLFAGVVATGIDASVWLLAFSLFVFLSLALLKRCAELVVHENGSTASTPGRDYRVADMRVLWPLGVALGISSIVVFVLYANAPEVRARYASPLVLWLVAVGFTYWLARLWLKTSRGEMTDDPIVYALKDFGSRATLIAIVAATLCAHFFRFG